MKWSHRGNGTDTHVTGIVDREIGSGTGNRATTNGKVVVVDLGIPQIKKVDRTNFLGEVSFDTSYWSPTQLQNKSLNAQSQVFSLGMLICDLLAGKKLLQLQ